MLAGVGGDFLSVGNMGVGTGDGQLQFCPCGIRIGIKDIYRQAHFKIVPVDGRRVRSSNHRDISGFFTIGEGIDHFLFCVVISAMNGDFCFSKETDAVVGFTNQHPIKIAAIVVQDFKDAARPYQIGFLSPTEFLFEIQCGTAQGDVLKCCQRKRTNDADNRFCRPRDTAPKMMNLSDH